MIYNGHEEIFLHARILQLKCVIEFMHSTASAFFQPRSR